MNFNGLCAKFEFIQLIYKLIEVGGLDKAQKSDYGVIRFWESGDLSLNPSFPVAKNRKNENLLEFFKNFPLTGKFTILCPEYFSHVIRVIIGTTPVFRQVMCEIHPNDAVSLIKECLDVVDQDELNQALMINMDCVHKHPYVALCLNKPEWAIQFRKDIQKAILVHYKYFFSRTNDAAFNATIANLSRWFDTSDYSYFNENFRDLADFSMFFKYMQCPVVLQHFFDNQPKLKPLFEAMCDYDMYKNILNIKTTLKDLKSMQWCTVDYEKLKHPLCPSIEYRMGLLNIESGQWLINQSAELIEQIAMLTNKTLEDKYPLWKPRISRKKLFLGIRDLICIIVENDLKISDDNLFYAFNAATEQYDTLLIKELFSDLDFRYLEALGAGNYESLINESIIQIRGNLLEFLKELAQKEFSGAETEELYEAYIKPCKTVHSMQEYRTTILNSLNSLNKASKISVLETEYGSMAKS